MSLNTRTYRLEDLSDLEYEVHIGSVSENSYRKIMILKFIGVYGFGSRGNSDARYMSAIGKAVLEAWRPDGVVIDLSDMQYDSGDELDLVFDVGSEISRYRPFPLALTVGPKSEKAVRTLLLGVGSEDGIESAGWVFRSVEEGWAYIASHFAT